MSQDNAAIYTLEVPNYTMSRRAISGDYRYDYGQRMVQVGYRAFITGGHKDPKKCLSLSIDPSTNTFKSTVKASMLRARDRHSACVYGRGFRYIFVSGAYNGPQARSVERYDTFTDTWRVMASLNIGRSFHASCSAKNGNDRSESVYVFCGFQKTKNNTLQSVEKLL